MWMDVFPLEYQLFRQLIGLGFMALAAYSTSLSAYAFANYRSKVLFAVLGCPLILATLPVVGVVLMAGGIATNSPSWTCVVCAY